MTDTPCAHHPLLPGHELTLHVDSLASDGRGLARSNGLVVFMERALPGQRVRARILALRKRLVEATVEEILTPSPDEQPALCPHAAACGGCLWQTLPYEHQLFWKQRIVEDALGRLGHIANPPVLPILPSPERWGYRNKMAFAFGTREDGGLALGQRGRRSHTVIDLYECLMQTPITMQLLAVMRQFARDTRLPAYDAARQSGFWRALVIRRNQAGRYLAECIVAPHPNGRQAAVRLGRQLADTLMNASPAVSGVVLSRRSAPADLAQGEETLLLAGDGTLSENMQRPADVFGSTPSLELHFDCHSFFQVNTSAAERLYGEAARLLAPDRTDCLLDLYCGVGGIGLFLAPLANRVFGVEVTPQAIKLAIANARRAGLAHCRFESGDAAKAFASLGRQQQTETAVVVDPPRAGLASQVCEGILRLRPRRLVYISCNPATLARDAQRLATHYVLKSAQPVDLFPQTQHVECASLFTLREPA